MDAVDDVASADREQPVGFTLTGLDEKKNRASNPTRRRTKRALDELYAYYTETEEMMTNLIRDESLHPAVPPLMANYWNYIDGIASLLLTGRGLRGRLKSRTAAAIRLAVDFRTWQLLVQEGGLGVGEAASVMSAAAEEAGLLGK